jgi:CubicO group peptidase (beta-lactamase class C family)
MKMKSINIWLLSLTVLTVCSCAAAPTEEMRAPCAIPSLKEDQWDIATPEQVGINAAELCSLFNLVKGEESNVHGILIERHGKLFAEFYQDGKDSPINRWYGLWSRKVVINSEYLHDARSISKSVISLIFGIADKKKKIDLHQPFMNFYPEIRDKAKDAQGIAVENLMTMTSGLKWDEGTLPNDETSLYWKKNQAKFFSDRDREFPPGHMFHYNSGGTAVLADIISKSSGEPWIEIARRDLFAPLGITDWEWVEDFRDRPLAFTGLRMRHRDLLKIGRLVANQGRWKDQEIVPQDWIRQSTQSRIQTGVLLPNTESPEFSYGYQWWLGEIQLKQKKVSWIAAFGNGGQRIYIVPSMDLVVVITAGEYGSTKINQIVQKNFENILKLVRN